MNAMVVLFVDDDIEDFEFFCEAVKTININAHCLHARDGQEACRLLGGKLTVLPDYIFLDINMPVMGGRECLRQIKAEGALKHIPVFIYSTTTNPFEMKAFIDLGAEDFIVKPSSLLKLINALKHIFPAQI